MKKILMVIHNMRIGGAQKSLLSFLQCLAEDQRHEDYEIHVLPIDPAGEFLHQLPGSCRVKEPDRVLRWMGSALSRALLTEHFSMRAAVGEAAWLLRKRLGRLPDGLNTPQQIWHSWKRFVPPCDESYDAAIAYMDGTPAYYVMDKVQAKKKVLWLHSDYQKQAYQPGFDKPYFEACDAVVTISEECRESALQCHPYLAEKLHVLDNISASAAVLRKSEETGAEEFSGAEGLRLLTVGRLHEQKGIDIAVEAARCLKAKGIAFRWLVVGEGAQRPQLESQIAACGLENEIFLLGSRVNPYVYMAKCDILIQPSRVEGKSIVLDEAKILCKPIIATAYSTVRDAIEHGETGWIVSMTGEAVADGIQHLSEHPELTGKLLHKLQQLPKGNEALVGDYLKIMF